MHREAFYTEAYVSRRKMLRRKKPSEASSRVLIL
jgi:hypothetical protein